MVSRPGHENYNTTIHSSCSTSSLLLAAETKFIRKFPARNLSNANDESLRKFRAASAKRSRNFRSRKKITHETTQEQMEKILKYRAAAAQRQREYRRRKKELTDELSGLPVKNKKITFPENDPKPEAATTRVTEADIVEETQKNFDNEYSHEYSATRYSGEFITSDTMSLTPKMVAPRTCSICRRYDGCPYPLNEAVKPVSDIWFEGIDDQEALIRRILKMNQNYCESRCCVCQNCYSEFHRIYSFLSCCVEAHNHMLGNQANLSQVQDVAIKHEPPCDVDFVPTMETVPTHVTNVKTEPIVDYIQSPLFRVEPGTQEAGTKWVIEEYLTENMTKDDAVVETMNSESFTVAAVSVESEKYGQIREQFPSDSEYHNRLDSVTFSCTECPATFTCSNDLKSHQLVHNYQKYSCENCGQQFGKIEGLKAHQRVHTGETFDCDDCGIQFTRSDALRKHKLRRGGVTFPCDECGAEYRSQCSLESHKQSHTGETFDCTECSAKFRTRQAHRNHMRIHTGIKLNCDQCGAQFLNEILLRTHRRIHTGETYNCDQCDAKFIRSYSLTLHRFIHAGKSYACSQCPAKCYTARGLKAHVRYKHKKIKADKIFSCDLCDAKFTTKMYLKIHKRSHNSDINVDCAQCSAKFDSIDSLKIHEQKHTVERFKCDQCEAKFSRKDSLVQHTRIHTGATFDCDQCDAKFTKLYTLRNHKRVHTGEMFSCDQCYAKFSFLSNLRTHQKVQHEKPTEELDDKTGLQQLSQNCNETKEQKIIPTIQEEEQFKCDQCEAKFTCRKNLRVHKRSRHSGMSFGCDECNAQFSTMEFLKRHQPIHTGQKFTCDQCDAKFSRESYLKIHRRIHTGLTFNCDQCDAKFITAHLLQRHLWTHTGQKPYACNQCDARFLETRSLKSHMRRHTGERLKCDRCDARFIREDTLKAHKKTHIDVIAEQDVVVEEASRRAESVENFGESQDLLYVEEIKIEI